MAAYAQYGYSGFPSASQSGGTEATQGALAEGGSLNGNTSSLSSAEGADCTTQQTGTGDVPSGALSPEMEPQSSNSVVGTPAIETVSGNRAGDSYQDGNSIDMTSMKTNPCCEHGRLILSNPVSGQAVCSCQYDSARLALSGYSRLPSSSVGVYGTSYPSTDQSTYQSIGIESSAFYSPLNNSYTLKDTAAAPEMSSWNSPGLQPSTGYYSYDPMSAYGYGASYDLAARRKNATRESTATLKAWLNEHKKNPYPTKGEKIMLAIITKMTLTQVSTWFANARRRLKKENKMTWEPKNRTDEDDDGQVSDDEKEGEDFESKKDLHAFSRDKDDSKDEEELTDDQKSQSQANLIFASFGHASQSKHSDVVSNRHGFHPYHHQHLAYYHPQQVILSGEFQSGGSSTANKQIEQKNQVNAECGMPIPASKPKIWSLADTVACKSPPPAFMGQGQDQVLPLSHHADPTQNLRQHREDQQRVSVIDSPFLNGTPYLRAHTTAYGGFLGGTTQQLHNANNTLYHPNIYSRSSPAGSHMSMVPTVTKPNTQAIQQCLGTGLQPHLPLHAADQAMGFPEAHPDTPPQTPPNLKVMNATSNILPIVSQALTTATCRNTNNFNVETTFPVSPPMEVKAYKAKNDALNYTRNDTLKQNTNRNPFAFAEFVVS